MDISDIPEPDQETLPHALLTACLDMVDGILGLSDEEARSMDLGDAETLAEILDRKRQSLEDLEAGLAELDKEALQGHPQMVDLISRLTDLRTRAERDMERAQVKTVAIRKVLHEVKKVRGRHGLGGLYGADGRHRKDSPVTKTGIDRSI